MLKKYKTVIIIFIVALILRLIFSFLFYRAVNFDTDKFLNSTHSDGYYNYAYNLIHYKVFSGYNPPTILDSTRTPGYPLIIAASLFIFNSLWPLVIIQIIISSLLPILGRKISREIIPNNSIANLVGWLLVFEPVGVMLSLWMISESFFVLFFFLFILFIIKFIKAAEQNAAFNNYKTIGWSAFLLGMATLIKPTTLYLPIILIAAWLAYRYFLKRNFLLKQVIIFLIIFILILSPWYYRNYRAFGVAALTSNKEEVLFTALAPSVLAVKNHESYSQSLINFFKSKGIEQYPIINTGNAGWFQQQAIEVLIKNPKESIIVAGISLLTFFTHDGLLTFLGFLGFYQANGLTVGQILTQPLPEMFVTFKSLFFSSAFFIILMRFLWILIAAIFFISIIRTFLRKKFTALSALGLIFVAYFALTTISNGFGVNARFRFPVNIFIFMFAIEYLFEIFNSFRRKIL